MEKETENLGQTLARELKQPTVLLTADGAYFDVVATPSGWNTQTVDREHLLAFPRHKRANVQIRDVASFIVYVNRHAGPHASVWCDSDPARDRIEFIGIMDDHGGAGADPGWRANRTTFRPAFTEEWKTWQQHNKKPFTQTEFAEFIEGNLRDVATVDGFPTGAAMLEMAVNMEALQEVKFKSALRLMSGAHQLQFEQNDDAHTVTRMDVFQRFALGLSVFVGGAAYQLTARLRYRVREGRLAFWYEIVRPDLTFQDAAKALVDQISSECGTAFYFGVSA